MYHICLYIQHWWTFGLFPPFGYCDQLYKSPCIFISLEEMPTWATAGSNGNSINFEESPNCFPKWLHYLYSYQQCMRLPISPNTVFSGGGGRGNTCSMWRFSGQESNLHHNRDPSHCSDNARFLTHCATGERLQIFENTHYCLCFVYSLPSMDINDLTVVSICFLWCLMIPSTFSCD